MKSPMMVAAVVVGGLACFLIFVALGTNSWATNEVYGGGLFLICNKNTSICVKNEDPGALQTLAVSIVFSWLFSVVATIFAMIYYCIYARKEKPSSCCSLFPAILFFISCAFNLLAVIAFASKGKRVLEKSLGKADLGFSFALDIIGALLVFAAGVLILVHRTPKGSQSEVEREEGGDR